MTNRAKKISELAEQTAPSTDDLLVIVDSPSGTAVTKKATVGNLFASRVASGTPASNTATAVQGMIMYNSTHLYIATANNVWRRVALSTF